MQVENTKMNNDAKAVSYLPIGKSKTFLPVKSWNVNVTGIEPPSLVKSGSTSKT